MHLDPLTHDRFTPRFDDLHRFYDMLCPTCAPLNYEKVTKEEKLSLVCYGFARVFGSVADRLRSSPLPRRFNFFSDCSQPTVTVVWRLLQVDVLRSDTRSPLSCSGRVRTSLSQPGFPTTPLSALPESVDTPFTTWGEWTETALSAMMLG